MTNADGRHNQQWAKSPMHRMRSDALHHASSNWKVATFLELGAGTGSLSQEFVDRGFGAILYDIGAKTCDGLRDRFAGQAERVHVIDTLDSVPAESVDYLFAFEVLEHIADDVSALNEWTDKLQPGGSVLISVPAHARKYGPSDRRVGHVRRYERAQLKKLLASAGYVDIQVICYGFPLGNITRKVGNLLQRNAAHDFSLDPVARSIDSGMRQSGAVLRLARSGVLNRWTLAPFLWLQRFFYGTERGDGYVAWGRLEKHAE
jgi:SAM-dependent methyltransferase